MKQKISKRVEVMLLASAITLSSLGAALFPENAVVTQAATVKISARKLSLTVGQSKLLKITGTKEKVKWSTNKKSVATVSSKGKVQAKKAGTAKITAKVAKKKYICTVTVKKEAANYIPNTKPEETAMPGVKDSIEYNFSTLKNYILTYGSTNSDGNKFVALGYDIDGFSAGIVYESPNSLFRFIFYNSTSVLTLEINENNIKNGKFRYAISLDSGLYGDCAAFETLGTLDGKSSLDWEAGSGIVADEVLFEVADAAYGAGYSFWELLLTSEVDLSMADLGFIG